MVFNTYSNFFYLQLSLVLLTAFTIRICVSLWGYSGDGKPPMYGDFEAQRHWMEITVNLPPEEWYVDTKNNDLQYWGLDYPPLTAYHMMLNGKMANYVNPQFVELNKSRGIEGPNIKFFMRVTVLLMDLLLFMPTVAAYFMLQRASDDDENDILTHIVMLIGYPGLVLIDNGHFQYNNVSLSMFILATLALSKKHDLIGAFLFCLALNYKQMELYHALPFFSYLFGSLIKLGTVKGMSKLTALALIVIITFFVVWSPFLYSVESAIAVFQRLFPVGRGLYEDKVSNFWCAVSVVIKFKQIFSQYDMAVICLVVTTLFLLPSFLHLLQNPSIRHFHYALVNSALVFFLFSFHVHEKTILLAVIPSCLLIKTDALAVVWFMLISVFSMLPLLIKDGLFIPTIATVGIFWLTTNHYLKPTKNVPENLQKAFQYSLLAACCIGLGTIFIPPPSRYPDLFPLLISIFSCSHFIMFAFYFHYKQFDSNYDKLIEKTNADTDSGELDSEEKDRRNRSKAIRYKGPQKSVLRYRRI
ncbi:unnamed protein product [Lymnaea stagnalis]|uniref:Alpha-1,3-glucosyltransferase n=1 Tax=Lymnaea stagnalis TaxID=6523 RepID=A0AAV2HDR7_LYMST